MGLLFKKGNHKIVKRQYGGSIPFYTSFQVQHAQQAPFNPSTLLAKYQGPAPTAPGKTAGKAKGDIDMDIPEITGLSNDAAALGMEISDMYKELQMGLDMDPKFLERPYGQELKRNIDIATSVKIQQAKNNQETFNTSMTTLHKQGGEDEWVFDGDRVLAMGIEIDENGQPKKVFQKVSPKQIKNDTTESGGQKWIPLTYRDAANYRATLMHPDFLYNGKFGEELTRQLNQGMSVDYIRGYMKNNYDNIGKTAQSWLKEIGGNMETEGGTEEAKKILERYMQSEATETNKNQLEAAFSNMRTHLEGPPMIALRGHFWKTSKSEAEVQDKINKFLATHMAQQLNISLDTKEVEKWDTPSGADRSGDGSGGPLKKISPYNSEASGTSKPDYVDLELQDVKDPETSSTLNIPVFEASETNKLLNYEETLAGQKDFNSVGVINNAKLANGEDLNDLQIDLNGTTMQFSAAAMPAKERPIRVAFIPMRDGKPASIDPKKQEKYDQELKEIEDWKKSFNDDRLFAPGMALAIEYNKKKAKAEANLMEGLPNDVKIEKQYILDVIYYKGTGTENIKNKGNVSGPDAEAYKNKFQETYEEGWDFWTEIGPDDLGKTTIMIPVKDELALQHAGGQGVWVPQVYTTETGLIDEQNTSDLQSYQTVQEIISAANQGRKHNNLIQNMYVNQNK